MTVMGTAVLLMFLALGLVTKSAPVTVLSAIGLLWGFYTLLTAKD